MKPFPYILLLIPFFLAASSADLNYEKRQAQDWGVVIGMPRDVVLSIQKVPQVLGSPNIVYQNDSYESKKIIVYSYKWETQNLRHQKNIYVDGSDLKVIREENFSVPK